MKRYSCEQGFRYKDVIRTMIMSDDRINAFEINLLDWSHRWENTFFLGDFFSVFDQPWSHPSKLSVVVCCFGFPYSHIYIYCACICIYMYVVVLYVCIYIHIFNGLWSIMVLGTLHDFMVFFQSRMTMTQVQAVIFSTTPDTGWYKHFTEKYREVLSPLTVVGWCGYL